MTDLIQVKGLGKTSKAQIVLQDVTFRVPQGMLSVISGAPRSGKTSVLRVMLGLEAHQQGQCSFLDLSLHLPARKQMLHLGLKPPRMLPWVTCAEFLLHLPHYQALLDPQTWVYTALTQVGLQKMAHVSVWSLKRHQKVKLWIAAQMGPQGGLLLLDEPMQGLNVQERQDLWLVLRRLVWEGRSVLLTTSCLKEAEMYGEYLVLLDQGRVVAQGEFAQLTAQRRVILEVEDTTAATSALHQLGLVQQVEEVQGGVMVDLSMEQVQKMLPLLQEQCIQVRECHPEALVSLYLRLQQAAP
ncbi:ATP-binding cassette domain-containing protein [Deinococcus roseus]|uniref:ABC transporter ATP-binding protein n=1 Tax=Deinococcus roseus TaxID=392414 RepID=A0ABQ2D585_9DEIO|nr:ATP-binding cassette domain-containing protein [Deinococcus roseus]GGJ46625.1 ABC transporter ATP-binding protein [Deinococcus roseus]